MNPSGLYQSDYKTVAGFCPQDFIPDADLFKPVWHDARRVGLVNSPRPETPPPSLRTHVATLWTKSYLYVAFWCQYSELHTYEGEEATQERWGLWSRDVVEVFINPNPERMNSYWEFEVAPNNQWIDLAISLEEESSVDASWNSGFQHATRIDKKNKEWYCEMGVPVASMGVRTVLPGMEWRINFYRCAGRGEDSQRHFLAWSPTLDPSFHIPSRFGAIRFQAPNRVRQKRMEK